MSLTNLTQNKRGRDMRRYIIATPFRRAHDDNDKSSPFSFTANICFDRHIIGINPFICYNFRSLTFRTIVSLIIDLPGTTPETAEIKPQTCRHYHRLLLNQLLRVTWLDIANHLVVACFWSKFTSVLSWSPAVVLSFRVFVGFGEDLQGKLYPPQQISESKLPSFLELIQWMEIQNGEIWGLQTFRLRG